MIIEEKVGRYVCLLLLLIMLKLRKYNFKVVVFLLDNDLIIFFIVVCLRWNIFGNFIGLIRV